MVFDHNADVNFVQYQGFSRQMTQNIPINEYIMPSSTGEMNGYYPNSILSGYGYNGSIAGNNSLLKELSMSKRNTYKDDTQARLNKVRNPERA